MIIEMSEQQKNNLLIFLERITLTPKEVPAYIEIVQLLTNTKEVGEEDGNA